MPIALFVALMGMMYLGVTSLSSSSAQKSSDDAVSAAAAMGTYHTLAVKQCTAPNTCGDGQVSVHTPPGSNMNMASLTTRFASYSDGNYVVTVLTPDYAAKLNNKMLVFNNALGASARNSVLAGPYVPDQTAVSSDYTSQLVLQSDGTRKMETGLINSRLRNIPASIGGKTLTSGMPIMATPIY